MVKPLSMMAEVFILPRLCPNLDTVLLGENARKTVQEVLGKQGDLPLLKKFGHHSSKMSKIT